MDARNEKDLRNRRGGPRSLRAGTVQESRGAQDRSKQVDGDFQGIVDSLSVRHVDLDVYFEVIAHGDVEQDEHNVIMGPGQRSGMKRLLRALEEWQAAQ